MIRSHKSHLTAKLRSKDDWVEKSGKTKSTLGPYGAGNIMERNQTLLPRINPGIRQPLLTEGNHPATSREQKLPVSHETKVHVRTKTSPNHNKNKEKRRIQRLRRESGEAQ